MVQPNFIGLGAQKCASSWIHMVLEDHPEVFVSQPKELDFFTHHFNRGYSWYEHFFVAAGTAQAIGEVSPSYFCDPLAPQRVHQYNPEIKLILALRDPVRRAFSNHLHEIRKGHFFGADLRFEAGLASNPMYLFQSRYGAHLDQWLKVFPQDQLLVVFQEEVQSDPSREARRIYEFLGVDADHQSAHLFDRVHESVGARHPALFRAWRSIGDLGRRWGFGTLVEALKRIWPIAAIMAANRRDLRAEIPKMRAETEQALQQELAADLVHLARLLGRDDLPWPSWQAVVASKAASDEAPTQRASSG